MLGIIIGASSFSITAALAEQQRAAEATAAAAADEQADAAKFREAVNDCDPDRGYAVIGDGGSSLTIDNEGEDDFGGVSGEDMWCIVTRLNAPAAVISHMEQTTSMDGRQTEAWDNIEVSWSYHPDRGMDSVWQITH